MLPIPQGWTSAPRRRWGPSVTAAIAGAVFVAMGVAAAAAGDEAPGLALGIGAFWWGAAVAFRPRSGLGMTSRDGALVIPRSRSRAYAFVVAAAAFGLGVASSVGLPWGVAVVAVYAVAIGVVVLRTGLGGEIRLDGEGVTFAYRPYGRRVPWDDVRGVRAERRGRIVVDAPGEGVWVRTDPLEADPVAVYWTLRYYAAHPEARGELADGRALDRVRREALT